MTVNPGFGGQKFLHNQLPKMARLRKMIDDRPIWLEIDGGVTPYTAPLAWEAGVEVMVAGSSVFEGGTPTHYSENIKALRRSCE